MVYRQPFHVNGDINLQGIVTRSRGAAAASHRGIQMLVSGNNRLKHNARVGVCGRLNLSRMRGRKRRKLMAICEYVNAQQSKELLGLCMKSILKKYFTYTDPKLLKHRF